MKTAYKGMNSIVRFVLMVILILAAGCAAPMTEVVANREYDEIDQTQFDQSDEVWVTYEDTNGTVRTKRGRVSIRTVIPSIGARRSLQ